MNVPNHSKICACPCACNHAGDKVSTVCWALIESKFHTPRNVPGSNINRRVFWLIVIP